MICAVIASAVDLTFPMVSRHAMYQLLPEKAFEAFRVMLFVGIAYFIRAICYYIMTYWGHTFGARVEADIRRIFSDICKRLILISTTKTEPVHSSAV